MSKEVAFTYREGFQELPYLVNSPQEMIESYKKMSWSFAFLFLGLARIMDKNPITYISKAATASEFTDQFYRSIPINMAGLSFVTPKII
jgi:hypothetical protein